MKRPDITPGPWEVDDAYEATFHNDNRMETVYEINGRAHGNTPAYATSREHATAIAALPALLDAFEKLYKAAVPIGDIPLSALTEAETALAQAGYTFD